ncbi:unnamed protein product [Paramecium sonneborni]|uniref:Transmembrane protein n=1 Tax=Paramecium sonneborni TaxID=65129 RepID=A0A8S1QW74_9CILI|nr:unnamed protein product [Paramecium sonneborni]
MNPLTLKFHDRKLEQKYQENYSNELYDAFKYTMVLLSLSNVILSIFWIQRNEFTLGCLMIIVCCGQTITFYYILIKKKFITLVGYLISILSLLSSFYQFLPYFYKEYYDTEFIWIFDISQFMALNFALSPNFILNQFLQILFVSSRLFMRNSAQLNPFSFILLLYLILFWQKEYFRQKHNRTQFFLKEQQKQALFLWDNLIEEKIVLLSYDEIWNKIDLVFANSSIKQVIEIDSKDFLKGFRISNLKIDLYQYLLEQIHHKNYQFQIKVVHSSKKYVIDCIMNKLMELNISLKFTELQSQKDYQNNYSYLKLLKKIKFIDKQLYYNEIQKQIIQQSYYFKNVTINQVEQLSLFKIRSFMNFIMKRNSAKILFDLQQFNTNLPLFFSLLSCLSKLYKIQEIQLVEQSQNLTSLIIYGFTYKIPEQRFAICKKIINHIVDQIGIYECLFYKSQFLCTLVNMQYKIESIAYSLE